MAEAKRPIFRQQALQFHMQHREKDILPFVVTPSAFLLLWVVLSCCIATAVVFWFGQVPIYASGVGVVVERASSQGSHAEQEIIALIFLPTDPAHPLPISVGASVLLSLGGQAQQLNTTVDRIESGMLSPRDAEKDYVLNSTTAQLIIGPSVAVSVKLGPTFQRQAYIGSNVNAQVQVGSRGVLSLLLGLQTSLGE